MFSVTLKLQALRKIEYDARHTVTFLDFGSCQDLQHAATEVPWGHGQKMGKGLGVAVMDKKR